MAEKEVFSKAPLTEVIFEIRFLPNLSVACKRDDFYNEIKTLYPVVSFPTLTFDKHPFEQPTQYLNSEKNKLITCSAESLSISTNKYAKFSTFKEECVKLVTTFHDKYPTVNSITRLGLRYTNRIPVERKDTKIDLAKYLKFSFYLPDSLNKNKLEFFQTTFFVELEIQTCGIRVNINSINDKGNEAIILDFDLICFKEIKFNEIEKCLISYHDKIEDVFLDITTESYKASIR
jgi:uncharacterized protein (TIGR04255 family)